MTIVFDMVPSPVGDLLVTAEDAGLTGIWFPREGAGPQEEAALRAGAAHVADAPGRAADIVRRARIELEEYFAGRRTTFTVPLAPRGTPFQQRVWAELRRIEFGGTISYAELARRLGSPSAVRAVGGANGRNPIPIVVPCHRVIGADGSLTGFGGGIERKRWLLSHEGALPARSGGAADAGVLSLALE
jgi:methylated-DNA-[protein]-cysteine S-methyltransferase